MGFEPLPFDPRNACFCRQNCPSFRQPTSRWWTVWSNPPPSIPELGTGVLVEFTQVITIPPFCRFRPGVLPVGVFVYFLDIGPLPPIPGPTVKRNVAAFTNVGSSFAELVVDNEECNIPLNLPPQLGSGLFGGCNIFPVRWFENANDVPH